jgi:hypothetical protein
LYSQSPEPEQFPAEEIAALKVRIAKLEADYDAATTPEERIAILNMITAKENRLTEMMRAQAAATGNYTARDLTSFYVTLDSFFIFVSGIGLTPWLLLYIYF